MIYIDYNLKMTATGHAVIGTVIAAKIGDPLFAIPIAFASHFLADVFPHWDIGTHWRTKALRRFLTESASDVLIGYLSMWLLVTFIFPGTNLFYAFVIVTVAQLPDWLMAPYLFFKIDFGIFKWFYQLQHKLNRTLDKPWGIINQIIVLVLLIILAKIL